jgi:hypothetical protein
MKALLAGALLLALLMTSMAFGQTRTYPMTMTWQDNSNNEDGFIVYMKNAAGAYAEVGRTTAGINTFTYSATGIEGTTICFAVSAYNTGGESTKSADGCGAIPVTIPVAVTALNGTITPLKLVSLNWIDGADNEQGTKVYRNGVEVATVPPSTGVGGVRTYTEAVTGAPGTVYTYEVAPFNSAGIAAKSSVLTLTVPFTAPAAPGAPNVTVGQRTAQLDWKDLPAEIGYQVLRNGVVIGETDQNVATYFDKGLEPNRWQSWAIRALYVGGLASSWSPSTTKKTLK